ncbi:spore coat protein [Terrilactibacillus sp. BCM23-1]|uniref:Spore coat protein n=1 Tax=Terrilactibacillus tamarindi TaxID=2599694 RepID=A0A6N8CQZ6_9BACI|nr:spore coat protein [Terrilactibacillus tamarindi]MTT31503.1 spore coat protein [Terrilactibacillus tamarindi]
MQNQQNQTSQNTQTYQVPPNLNHGGHELFDVHEVLSGSINTLNTYMLMREFVKDPELRDILDRQYQFIQDEYNLTCECFKTGQHPSKRTEPYMMKQNNDFIYGMTPTSPKKPMQSTSEISDQFISGTMLSCCKQGASARTMAATESTNPVVRRVLAASIANCIEMAYEISLYQNKHKYYQVPQLAQEDMQQILNSYAPAQTSPMQNNNMTH